MNITCKIDAPDLQKAPQKGPFIIYANHTGQIEIPIFFAYLQPRKITGWAKAEAWENKFIGFLFDLWHAIPLHRGEADMAALRGALQALKDGYLFGLSPEGTRNRTGVLKRALPGAVTIALHSNAPIFPFAHWGGEDFPQNIKKWKRTEFHIRAGEPYRIDTKGERVTSEIRQQIADEMMYLVAEMLPEKYRGEYSDLSKATRKYIQKY